MSQRQLAGRLGVSLGKTNFLIGEKVRMTRAYLARKEAEYEALQAEIQALKQEMTSADEPH